MQRRDPRRLLPPARGCATIPAELRPCGRYPLSRHNGACGKISVPVFPPRFGRIPGDSRDVGLAGVRRRTGAARHAPPILRRHPVTGTDARTTHPGPGGYFIPIPDADKGRLPGSNNVPAMRPPARKSTGQRIGRGLAESKRGKLEPSETTKPRPADRDGNRRSSVKK